MAEEENKPDISYTGYAGIDMILVEKDKDIGLCGKDGKTIRAISIWMKPTIKGNFMLKKDVEDLENTNLIKEEYNLTNRYFNKVFNIKLIAANELGSVALCTLLNVRITAVFESYNEEHLMLDYTAEKLKTWEIFTKE
jgi:hypothetical protein